MNDATSAANCSRVFIEKVTGKLMLTNSSEMPVEVKIYVVKCKIETSTSPIDAWSSGLTKNRITGDNV